jgi:hypothetical protein
LPVLQGKVATQFRVRMEDIAQLDPHDATLNMDDTSWMILSHNFVAVADNRYQTAKDLVKGGPKSI